MVKLLLAAVNINPNAMDPHSGNSALHCACQNGDVYTINLLLAKDGIDINLRNNTGNTPLMHAAVQKSVPAMESLLARNDLNPNIKNNEDDHVIYPSLSLGCTIVKLLLDHPRVDRNPNLEVKWIPYRRTGLMCCAWQIGDPDTAKLFLDREDIDVNLRDLDGKTALDLAIMFDKSKVTELLLDQDDLNLNHPDNIYGLTALHRACIDQKPSAVKMLLKRKGVDPNVKDYGRGFTPLAHACCVRDNLALVRLLLTHPDIDPNPVDNNGSSNLKNVMEIVGFTPQYRKELESLLRDHGASL
jgi:ankyrin repeat protein